MKKKIVFGSLLACFLMLTIPAIPITCGSSANIVEISRQKVVDDEKALMFLWLTGHLKDVEVNYNETYNITWYEGTVVNGIGVFWLPKEFIIPLPAFPRRGDTYNITKDFPEFHTRIIQLPNDHILFSMWFLGFVYIDNTNNTTDISLNESIEFGIFSKPFLSPFYADFISVKNA